MPWTGREQTLTKRDAGVRRPAWSKRRPFSIERKVKSRKATYNERKVMKGKEKGKLENEGKPSSNGYHQRHTSDNVLQQKKKIRKIMSVRRVKEKKKFSQERIFKPKEELSCCSDLWAELSNVALLRASNLEKQAKSITKYDQITKSKSAKGENFNQHQSILKQALANTSCPVNNKRGVSTTGKIFV